MRIFITGASGFIGGAIATSLKSSHTLFGMARSEKSADKLKKRGVQPVLCSLSDIQAQHLVDIDIVIHAAAFVEPWGSRKQFWDANVIGTQNVLKAAQAAGVNRFIHIGTEAVLFDGQDMIDIDENTPYPAHTPFLYSETKREAEKLVLAGNSASMTTISIRPRLVWGPNDTSILPNLLELVDKGAFRWIEKGQLLTSSTHIANLVDGVTRALNQGRGGQAYFITDGPAQTMQKFLTLLLATEGRHPDNKNAPGWLVRTAAWGIEAIWKIFGIRKKPPITRFAASIMSRHCTIRIDKAKSELAYTPVVSVEKGMAELKAANGH